MTWLITLFKGQLMSLASHALKMLLKRILKNGIYCKIVSTVALLIGLHLLYTQQLSNDVFKRDVVEQGVKKSMSDTLTKCGNLSFMTWSVIEEPNYVDERSLIFKSALACDIDKAKLLNPKTKSCIIDIKHANPVFLKRNPMDSVTLNFIEDNRSVLPDGVRVASLTPLWFNLIKDGKLTDDAQFIKIRTPGLWSILKDMNTTIKQIGIILVKKKNLQNEPVIYIFTLAFTGDSERKCNLEQTGKQEGDYLILIAKQALNSI